MEWAVEYLLILNHLKMANTTKVSKVSMHATEGFPPDNPHLKKKHWSTCQPFETIVLVFPLTKRMYSAAEA